MPSLKKKSAAFCQTHGQANWFARSAMDDIRYGSIGTGMMGIEHIENLAAVDGAVVTAVSDPDAGSLATGAAAVGADVATFDDHREVRTALTWVGLEYRYMPPVTRLVNEVRVGTVGDVHMLSIREHRFPFLTKVGDWNRFTRNTGGTLVEDNVRAMLDLCMFAEAIRTNSAPKVGVFDGLWSVAIGEAAHRSIDERRPVDRAELIPAELLNT